MVSFVCAAAGPHDPAHAQPHLRPSQSETASKCDMHALLSGRPASTGGVDLIDRALAPRTKPRHTQKEGKARGRSRGRRSSVSVGSTRPNNSLFSHFSLFLPPHSPRSPLSRSPPTSPLFFISPPVLSLSSTRLQSGYSSEASSNVAMERSLDSYSSMKDVTYSCGYCGYALNLSSAARNTAGIGSKYGKQIKKGVVSFVAVDESRFTLTDEVTCTPYFRSGRSWGFFRRRSRLLCRKCGGRIGNAYEEEDGRDTCGLSDGDGFSDDMRASSSGSGGSGSSASSHMNYMIKISALQPSSDDSYAL